MRPIPWFPVLAVLLGVIVLAPLHSHAKKPSWIALTLKVAGLGVDSDAKEVEKLKKVVKTVKGVKAVAANRKRGEITVRFEAPATIERIKKAVAKAGFGLVEPKHERLPDEEEEDETPPPVVTPKKGS